MIIIITGKPRRGKTALNTYFAMCELEENGYKLWKSTKAAIEEFNVDRVMRLEVPDKAPIYMNYQAKFHVGYKKWYEPYYLNPFYFGLPNDVIEDMQYVMPGSKIHITEGQRYFDSRESNIPDWQSREFELQGHFDLDIYIDVQRGKLIDLNIRELSAKFIEVQYMKHVKDETGETIRTTWYCREFECLQDYEMYMSNNDKGLYTETTYTYEGNIFEFYDCKSSRKEFIPPEGKTFSILTYSERDKAITEKSVTAKYFKTSKPPEYSNWKQLLREAGNNSGKVAA